MPENLLYCEGKVHTVSMYSPPQPSGWEPDISISNCLHLSPNTCIKQTTNGVFDTNLYSTHINSSFLKDVVFLHQNTSLLKKPIMSHRHILSRDLQTYV